MIVDDRPANLGFVVDHLESLGYRVIVALGGAEALRRIGFARPDLILLDAMMPEMDGFEVCRQLRAQGSMDDIPVIFMTALKQTDFKLSAFALGAVDYLTKPLQVDEVAARVATHLALRDARLQLQQQTRQLQQVRRELLDEADRRNAELQDSNRRLQFELAERYAAELALQASMLGYQEVFDHVSDALYLLEGGDDGQFRYVQINPAFAQLLGLPHSAVLGQQAAQLLGAAAGAQLQAACQRCVADGAPVELELVLELPGRRSILQLTLVRSRVPSRNGRHLVGIGRDVTRLHDYQAQLTFLAKRDVLTGLPNRHSFRDSLAQAVGGGATVGVLLLGLDHFRELNDGLGRAFGDRLLIACARLLEQAVGADGLVARIGGDEFAVLLAGDGAGQAAGPLARRLLRLLAAPVDLGDYELAVGCSIGISQAPQDGADAETLLCNVDTAMCRAKAEGGHRYQHFTAEMSTTTRRRVEIGNALRHAIRLAELSLHYQPRASVQGGAAVTVGMEALLRWDGQLLGRVAPSEFIPLAEQNGLILQIGQWVLERACHQAQAWRARHGAALPVAVNLSARQFRDADLVRMVEVALQSSGLPPHLLELELTESMLMQDARRTRRTLAALKAIGVRLAVDDFGTGYSSLSYLKSFPLDYLKIDRSFVAGLPQDRSDAAIVRAIIAMAHTLGLKVIAEGVETAGQLAFLRAQQCDEIQGYWFSRPLAVADMETYLGRPGQQFGAVAPLSGSIG
nr:EAL domain-containing protein [Duganella radicis]